MLISSWPALYSHGAIETGRLFLCGARVAKVFIDMTNINGERKTAKEAEAIIRSLVPSTPLTKTAVDALRKAADVAMKAPQGFSSQKALDAARHDAVMALKVVLGNDGSVTQDMIDKAERAVAEWSLAIEEYARSAGGA
jgi:hypothetical protein